MESKKYHRIVLKLSGEALAGKQGYGIDPETVETIAKQVVEVNKLGVQVAIVVGGGNIWRGLSGSAKGMDRVSADYMGMLATVRNSLALQGRLDLPDAVPGQIAVIDEADGLRLLRHDPWLAVGALLIAQQLLVLHGDMAGFHGLTLAPAHPAAGALALGLGEGPV